MQDINGNHVSLRDYVDRVFEEKQKALELAFKSQQDALSIATRNLDARLEKLNELRQEVTVDRGNFVTRDKYDTAIGEINKWQDRADGALTAARLLGAVGTSAAIVEILKFVGVIK